MKFMHGVTPQTYCAVQTKCSFTDQIGHTPDLAEENTSIYTDILRTIWGAFRQVIIII